MTEVGGLTERYGDTVAVDDLTFGGPMDTDRTSRVAAAIAVLAALFLVWTIGALGVVGAGGDPADHMFAAIFVVSAWLFRKAASGRPAAVRRTES